MIWGFFFGKIPRLLCLGFAGDIFELRAGGKAIRV